MPNRTSLALTFTVAVAALTAAQAHASLQQRCPASAAAIEESAARTLAQGSPGLVVQAAQSGSVVFAGAYGMANLEHAAPMRADTVFRLASVTKQFTAAAILLLVEDGRVSLDDRLSRFVPELPQAEEITLYQLLVQTSGLADYAGDETGLKTKSIPRSHDDMIEWIAGLEPRFLFTPGSAWGYSNSNYALLGAVIERVSGKDLQSFFAERVFAPAGLTNTSFDDPGDIVPHRAGGYRRSRASASGYVNADFISATIPGAAGGLRTTAGDLIRWSEALFGGRVLSPSSLELMTSPGLLNDGRTTIHGMPEPVQRGWRSDYAMGLFVTSSAAGVRYWHGGDIDGFSSWLAYYPEAALTIAVLQNSESADIDEQVIEDALVMALIRNCSPA